jgi:hypothetical protein
LSKENVSEHNRMVEVYRASSEAEALIIQGKLSSHGISSLLQGNAAPSVHVFAVDGLGEVRVMVWEKEKERAQELLKGEDNV